MPPSPKKRTATETSRWRDATVDVESLEEDHRLAHELVLRRRDLTPSVARIMDADIGVDARCRALTAFTDALDTPGDPNRDPRVAIISATS
jgi:hypothetical protein